MSYLGCADDARPAFMRAVEDQFNLDEEWNKWFHRMVFYVAAENEGMVFEKTDFSLSLSLCPSSSSFVVVVVW